MARAPTAAPAASGQSPEQRLDDDYPAYSLGRAAEILGVTPAFLRSLGTAKLIEPLRSEGGHRRFSRYQPHLAARAREVVDAGTQLEAGCRIIVLKDQLAEALRINEELRQRD
ncbi:MerR family DNA-binding transcriptional regulator [Nonomuraea sp. NPDC004702]